MPTRRESSLPESLIASSSERLWRGAVALTLVLYAMMQIFYITATPIQDMILPDNLPQNRSASLVAGIGPDEKEHFLYIISLANQGSVPKPAPRWRTSPDQYVSYQAQHPPVFYALGSVLYLATRSFSPIMVWYLLRGFCAFCGSVIIVLVVLSARSAFPSKPIVGLMAAPSVAFLPMFDHIMSNLSNEPLAMLLTAAAWLQLVHLARGIRSLTWISATVLGLTLGLAAETRLTSVMWLPAAVIVLIFCARRQSVSTWASLSIFLVCFLVLALPWFLHNQLAYGTAVLRPFDRPMLQGHSLIEFVTNPSFSQVALLTALWYASTAWSPFWLTQFYWPGGVRAEGMWQSLFLVLDVFALLALLLHSLRERRERVVPDAAGRALLWAAGSVVGVCVMILLQQQLYSDWDVLYSPGRYLVATAPASTLLFAFAGSMLFSRTRHVWPVAAVITLALLVFDVYTVTLVRQFYRDHPRQSVVQRL